MSRFSFLNVTLGKPVPGSRWRATPWWPSDTRQSQQHSLLRLLKVAHQERLELAPLIINFAREHRGGYRRVLLRLAKRLASGTSLVAALEQTPGALSESAILAVRFGSQSGTLTSTLESLLDTQRVVAVPQQANIRHFIYYWIVPTAVLLLCIAYLTNNIVPTLTSVSEDLAIHPSEHPALVTLYDVGRTASRYALPLLCLAFLVAAFLLSDALRRLLARVLPVRFMRPVAQLRSIELFRLLAVALDAGRPLPGSISTLARYHFDKHVRQKLLYARNEVEQGVDVWTSLVEAKVLTPNESAALANASSNAVRSWTLRRLADWKQATVQRRTAIALTFLNVVVLLTLASIVLWICVAVFGFLAQLIHVLS